MTEPTAIIARAGGHDRPHRGARVKHVADPQRDIERLIRMLSPAEIVIWRSLKGYVPIGFRRLFAEAVRRAAWDEEGLNRSDALTREVREAQKGTWK